MVIRYSFDISPLLYRFQNTSYDYVFSGRYIEGLRTSSVFINPTIYLSVFINPTISFVFINPAIYLSVFINPTINISVFINPTIYLVGH